MTGEKKLPPVQQRILNLLSDGKRHSRVEIHGCLHDELSKLNAIWGPISDLRKILRPKGEDILCEIQGRGIFYRHIRLLHTDE